MATLLIIAAQQRSIYSPSWAAVLGVACGLEGTFFDNRLYDYAYYLGLFAAEGGYFNGAPEIVHGALGLLMVGAGWRAWVSESR